MSVETAAVATATTAVTLSQRHASAFARVIKACNKFDGNVGRMWKFYLLDNSTPVGYVLPEFAEVLDFRGTQFSVRRESRQIHLNPMVFPGDDVAECCRQQFVRLCEANMYRFNGCLGRWLASEERCYHAIRWLDNREHIVEIPTPLRGILGVVTAGVHLNVYTLINNQPFMWVSQRSQTTTFPGMLDQMVAGAMEPEDGYSASNTLQHEAWEEAGLYFDVLSKRMFQGNVEIGTVTGPFRISFYDRKDSSAGPENGHIEAGVRYIFDMEVQPTFVPTPGTDQAIGGFS